MKEIIKTLGLIFKIFIAIILANLIYFICKATTNTIINNTNTYATIYLCCLSICGITAFAYLIFMLLAKKKKPVRVGYPDGRLVNNRLRNNSFGNSLLSIFSFLFNLIASILMIGGSIVMLFSHMDNKNNNN